MIQNLYNCIMKIGVFKGLKKGKRYNWYAGLNQTICMKADFIGKYTCQNLLI